MAKPDRAERVAGDSAWQAATRLARRWGLLNGVDEAIARTIRREVKRSVEDCAQIAEGYAEELKHTCHYGGPGFGDIRGEMACKNVAAAIRGRK